MLTCLLVTSCIYTGANLKKKVYTPDITIKPVNGIRYAYYNDELYTGDVYSSDEKSKMEIMNGLAIVAYANYGVTSGEDWEKEMEIHEDVSTLQNKLMTISPIY